jgi:uncharacterized protein YidB (DUF937 family)
MGLLDSILGNALGSALGGGAGAGNGNAALLNMVLGMLTQGGGSGAQGGGLAGLGELVSQFQRSGLGDVVSSWVSTGQNLPVSPEQLGQVFGGRVDGMASQLGMNPADLLGQLSQMLPDVVDRLTPGGQVPDASQMPNLSDIGNLLNTLAQRR